MAVVVVVVPKYVMERGEKRADGEKAHGRVRRLARVSVLRYPDPLPCSRQYTVALWVQERLVGCMYKID